MNDFESSLFARFLNENDFAAKTQEAFASDFKKWVGYFEGVYSDEYDSRVVTLRDVTDFRTHLREERGQAVATVNRCLVTLRRYFSFLAQEEVITQNPAAKVKELRRTPSAPKAIDRTTIRRMIREAIVREDVRASSILSLFVYCGLRLSEVAMLKLGDIDLSERRGMLVVKHGKNNKERAVPVPTEARRHLLEYLGCRPPVESDRVYIGQGCKPLGTDGVRYLVEKYGLSVGIKLHPHALRHSFATEFLAANNNDLVGLAQILGHESIQTTSRYTQRGHTQLAASSEQVRF
ncbi:xerC [Symbiodinium sp. CCMP2592]|nr:xerC [Symbiodinium sp. CCMP2592]